MGDPTGKIEMTSASSCTDPRAQIYDVEELIEADCSLTGDAELVSQEWIVNVNTSGDAEIIKAKLRAISCGPVQCGASRYPFVQYLTVSESTPIQLVYGDECQFGVGDNAMDDFEWSQCLTSSGLQSPLLDLRNLPRQIVEAPVGSLQACTADSGVPMADTFTETVAVDLNECKLPINLSIDSSQDADLARLTVDVLPKNDSRVQGLCGQESVYGADVCSNAKLAFLNIRVEMRARVVRKFILVYPTNAKIKNIDISKTGTVRLVVESGRVELQRSEGQDAFSNLRIFRNKKGEFSLDGVTYQPVVPPKTPKEVEYDKLKGELHALVGLSKWTDAEAKYQEIVALGLAIDGAVLADASYVARGVGNAQLYYERLLVQKLHDPSNLLPGIQGDLDLLQTDFGRVEIIIPEGTPHTLLVVGMLPFAAGSRTAVEFAQKQVADTGHFKGLLPMLDEGEHYNLVPAGVASDDPSATSFKPRSMQGQGTDESFEKIRPKVSGPVAQAEPESQRSPIVERPFSLWASVQGGGIFLRQPNGNQIGGFAVFGDIDTHLKPWTAVPVQFRAGAGAGWVGPSSDTESLSSIPVRETVGVDLATKMGGLGFAVGPSFGLEQHVATQGNLNVGTDQVGMTDPALQPITFIWGGRFFIGGAGWPWGFVVNYTRGATEVRGLLSGYDNVVGTTNTVQNNQLVVGAAIKLR